MNEYQTGLAIDLGAILLCLFAGLCILLLSILMGGKKK